MISVSILSGVLFLFLGVATGEYFTDSIASNWQAAEEYCVANGGHLASVHSEAQNKELAQVCKSGTGGRSCWIGLEDQSQEGVWQWIDGSAMDYGFSDNGGSPTTGVYPWNTGEPNNWGSNEDCILFLGNQDIWNDAACTTNLFPLCATPQGGPTETSIGSRNLEPDARYIAGSFGQTTAGVWDDVSANSNDVTGIQDAGSIASGQFANGRPFLVGPPTTRITFPPNLGSGSPYTLFSVTAYGAGTHMRILGGTGTNWLSGHWSNRVGVCYHNAWVMSDSQFPVDDWIIGSDRRQKYHATGYNDNTGVVTDSSPLTGGSEGPGQVTINNGRYSAGESSDFKVAEVIIFQRELSDAEVESVEAFLIARYTEAVPPEVDSDSLAYLIELQESMQDELEALEARLSVVEGNAAAQAPQARPLALGGSAVATASAVSAKYGVQVLVAVNVLFMAVMVCLACRLHRSGQRGNYKHFYARTVAESSGVSEDKSETEMANTL